MFGLSWVFRSRGWIIYLGILDRRRGLVGFVCEIVLEGDFLLGDFIFLLGDLNICV